MRLTHKVDIPKFNSLTYAKDCVQQEISKKIEEWKKDYVFQGEPLYHYQKSMYEVDFLIIEVDAREKTHEDHNIERWEYFMNQRLLT